jgi:predicted nucleic acid-binding protein
VRFDNIIVVDANVAVKWYLPEEGEEEAFEVFEAGASGETTLIAPDMILPEVGNVFWLRHRRGHISRTRVQEAWGSFRNAGISLRESGPLMSFALEIALDTGCAVYDALYVALAEAEDAKLITADRKLVRTLEGTPFGDSVAQL